MSVEFACFADLIWPALFLEIRLLNLWVIALGLVVEFVILLWPLRLPWLKALGADLLMNAASALFGVVMIPGVGLAWEAVAGYVLWTVFDVCTFNPLAWTVTGAAAVWLNTALEGAIVCGVFRVPGTLRLFVWLGIGNAVSVSAALLSLMLVPLRV